MSSSDSISESSYEESSSSPSEPAPPKKHEKRSKASKKSRKDKKKGSSKRKHAKHAKSKKSRKDKKRKDKTSEKESRGRKEPEKSWHRKRDQTSEYESHGRKEPEKSWQSWKWGNQSSGSDWKNKSKDDSYWKAEDATRSWKSEGAASSRSDSWWKSSWPRPKTQIAPPEGGKRRWGQGQESLTQDAWSDYWEIARENNKGDPFRVLCPAATRDEGATPTLHVPDEAEVSRFASETLLAFQAPRSMLEAVLRAMMQGGVTCPMVDGVAGIFQIRGEGWGHLVIALVEQDTEAPLVSPLHRELPESESHYYSFAHGTSQ